MYFNLLTYVFNFWMKNILYLFMIFTIDFYYPNV